MSEAFKLNSAIRNYFEYITLNEIEEKKIQKEKFCNNLYVIFYEGKFKYITIK